jgi:hypothetical protein
MLRFVKSIIEISLVACRAYKSTINNKAMFIEAHIDTTCILVDLTAAQAETAGCQCAQVYLTASAATSPILFTRGNVSRYTSTLASFPVSSAPAGFRK